MDIEIQPKELSLEITSIKIDVPVIVLNERAIIRVLMYDVNKQLVKSDTFEMIQPEYGSLWLMDNDLVNYVCQKYNFTRLIV